tara:strand:+ start:391 stop:549 length:159 start_codon:yes stop_codon:yes gene_type:complete
MQIFQAGVKALGIPAPEENIEDDPDFKKKFEVWPLSCICRIVWIDILQCAWY